MKAIREIIFYKDYFDEFFESLTQKVKDKIDEVLFMFTIIERIPAKFFKSIEGIKGLFEIRIEYESNRQRKFNNPFQWLSKEIAKNAREGIRESSQNNAGIF